MSSIARATFTITVFSTLGLVLGFLSNLVIASRFGAGTEMDTYLASTTLPTLIAVILSGSLSSSFLPVFSEYKGKDMGEAWRIVSAFMNLVLIASAVLCLAGMIFAHPIMDLLAPGFDAAQKAKSAELLRLLMPGILFTVLAELISGVYYSNGRFLTPTAIKLLAPLLTILFVIAFSGSLSLRSLAYATLCAGAIQSAVLLAGLFRDKDFRYSFVLDARHPSVRRILALMAPLILGMSMSKLLPAFERLLASNLSSGTISHLGYAFRLSSIAQTLVTSGISVSGFALMSRLMSERDSEGLRRAMGKSLAALAFVSVPLAVILSGFSLPIVTLLFERGAFTAEDSRGTALAFGLYALSLPASAMGVVIGQGFYVFQDTRTPSIIGFIEAFLYVGLCLLLTRSLGMAGIPIAYNIYFALSLGMCAYLLARKTGFSLLRMIAMPTARSLAAALPALVFGLGLARLLPGNILWQPVCAGFSLSVYLVLQRFVFRSAEARDLVSMVASKIALILGTKQRGGP